MSLRTIYDPNGHPIFLIQKGVKVQNAWLNNDETFRRVEFPVIKHVVEGDTLLLKIFWALLCSLSATIMIYEVYKTISNYLESPISTAFTIKTNDSMHFPQIYLCAPYSMQKFFGEEARQNASKYDKIRRQMMLAEPVTWADTDDANWAEEGQIDYEHLKSAQLELGIDADSFFLFCSFRESDFVFMPCESVYSTILDPEYGQCYLFDFGDRLQRVPSQGFYAAFNLKVSSSPKDPLSLVPKIQGLIMIVAEKYNPTLVDKMMIPTGTYARIDMKKQTQTQMAVDSNGIISCVTDYDFKYLNNVNYTRSTCHLECLLKMWDDACRCLPIVDQMFVKNNSVAFCTFDKLKTCIQRGNLTYDKNLFNCRAACLVPCNEITYKTRITTIPLHAPAFPEELENSTVDDLVYVQMSFSSMDYESFSQSATMALDDVISNVGGQIGLWLGFSMFSIMQIPIVLFFLCSSRFYKVMGKR